MQTPDKKKHQKKPQKEWQGFSLGRGAPEVKGGAQSNVYVEESKRCSPDGVTEAAAPAIPFRWWRKKGTSPEKAKPGKNKNIPWKTREKNKTEPASKALRLRGRPPVEPCITWHVCVMWSRSESAARLFQGMSPSGRNAPRASSCEELSEWPISCICWAGRSTRCLLCYFPVSLYIVSLLCRDSLTSISITKTYKSSLIQAFLSGQIFFFCSCFSKIVSQAEMHMQPRGLLKTSSRSPGGGVCAGG